MSRCSAPRLLSQRRVFQELIYIIYITSIQVTFFFFYRPDSFLKKFTLCSFSSRYNYLVYDTL